MSHRLQPSDWSTPAGHHTETQTVWSSHNLFSAKMQHTRIHTHSHTHSGCQVVNCKWHIAHFHSSLVPVQLSRSAAVCPEMQPTDALSSEMCLKPKPIFGFLWSRWVCGEPSLLEVHLECILGYVYSENDIVDLLSGMILFGVQMFPLSGGICWCPELRVQHLGCFYYYYVVIIVIGSWV